MLVSQVSLIFVMLNFEEFLNALMHFSTSSHDDLVNIVCKIFVAVSFFISVVTAFLEGVGHLWNRHFVHQSTKQVVQPTNQPVEETNATSVDALVADFDVAKIYLELERDFKSTSVDALTTFEIKLELERESNRQIELELELKREHDRRRELELELEIETKRKINFGVVGAVFADSSECAISDLDFLADQQHAIQDALGDSSVQITWGDLDSTSTTDTLVHFDVAGEVERALQSELELELELELILEEHYNSKCPVTRKKHREQQLGSRMCAVCNGR